MNATSALLARFESGDGQLDFPAKTLRWNTSGVSLLMSAAVGCLTAMAGADVAINLYERWAAKRLGLGLGLAPPVGTEAGQ